MDTIKDMIESLKGFAKKAFDDSGSVQPMWVLVAHHPEPIVMPIMAPFGSSEEKDVAFQFVRAKAKEINADLVGFMAEAWTVSIKTEGKEPPKGIVPSEHEDRREVIQIHAEDNKGNVSFGMYYILRPEHGNATLSPYHDISVDGISGRFSNILEKNVTLQ